jgi:hypothetical protein
MVRIPPNQINLRQASVWLEETLLIWKGRAGFTDAINLRNVGVNMKHNAKVLALFAVGLVTVCRLNAQLSLNAIDAGRYTNTGTSNATNANYGAGYISPANLTFRNFFAFDLTGITGSIVNPYITIFEPTGGFVSNVTPLTFGLFDVTTSSTTVLAGGSGLTAIYTDLGSGASYGSTSVSAANDNSFLTITLNSAFISDFIAREGSTLLIGGAITTALPQTNNERIFNGTPETGLTSGSVVLHFTAVPEPSTYGLIGAVAMAGLILVRRVRHKSDVLAS